MIVQSQFWRCRDRELLLDRTFIMGILNVTPDSFSDGGQFYDSTQAIARGLKLVAEGADILDIGGESTRPGAAAVEEAEELRRVLPVVGALVERTHCLISVDTSKAAVARAALVAGAHIINDISAAMWDAAMPEVVVEFQAGLVLMHCQGHPQTMQQAPHYADVVAEVRDFLAGRLETLAAAGLQRENMAIDPGIGFGKTLEHNLNLLRHLDRLVALGRPVLIGVSRKSMLGKLTGRDQSEQRLAAGLAAQTAAVLRGARIIRTHDVAAARDAARVADACHVQPPGG